MRKRSLVSEASEKQIFVKNEPDMNWLVNLGVFLKSFRNFVKFAQLLLLSTNCGNFVCKITKWGARVRFYFVGFLSKRFVQGVAEILAVRLERKVRHRKVSTVEKYSVWQQNPVKMHWNLQSRKCWYFLIRQKFLHYGSDIAASISPINNPSWVG